MKTNQHYPIHLLQHPSALMSFKEEEPQSPIAIQIPISTTCNASPSMPATTDTNARAKEGTKDATTYSEEYECVSQDNTGPSISKTSEHRKEDNKAIPKKLEPFRQHEDNINFHNDESLGSLSFLNDSTSVSNSHHFRPSSAASDNAMYGDTLSDSKLVNGDNFLDSVLEVSNGPCSSVLQTPVHQSTPPSSPPSSHLNASDSQSWLPELSLTSFLGNFGSASKLSLAIGGNSKMPSSSLLNHNEVLHPHLINEDSQQSTGSEVDRQLLSMMNENSVDFTSKFERLATAVTTDVNHTDDR